MQRDKGVTRRTELMVSHGYQQHSRTVNIFFLKMQLPDHQGPQRSGWVERKGLDVV